MKYVYIAIALICLTFLMLIGCSPSLVYSPSMNLSPKPLKKGQSQALAGVGYFPETRPEYTEHKTAEGGEATFRFALCDHFAMQFKGWKDFSDNLDVSRYGASFSFIGMLNDSSKVRFGLIPTGAFLFSGGDCDAGGGGLFMGIWFNYFKHVDFYSVIGPAAGARSLNGDDKQWGWGVFLNVGTAITVGEHLTFNLELAGIKQKNEYEHRRDYFLCPSINIGYIMERSKK